MAPLLVDTMDAHASVKQAQFILDMHCMLDEMKSPENIREIPGFRAPSHNEIALHWIEAHRKAYREKFPNPLAQP